MASKLTVGELKSKDNLKNNISDEYIKIDLNEDSEKVSHTNVKEKDLASTGIKNKENGDIWKNYFKAQHSRGSRSINLKSHVVNNTNGKTKEDELSDWETWWIVSSSWLRFEVLFVFFLFVISLLQLATAIWFFTKAFDDNPGEPTVCKTEDCINKSKWLQEAWNKSIDPCENFYGFVCGAYKDNYDHGDFSKEWEINTAAVEFGRKNILTDVLKTNKGKAPDPHIIFYQTCIDPRSRRKHNLTAFYKVFNDTFGDIWNSSYTLEDYAARVLGVVGDFGFFEFEFQGYPTIWTQVKQLGDPWWIESIPDKSDGVDLGDILYKLLPNAKLNSSATNNTETLKDVVERGIYAIKTNMKNLFSDSFIKLQESEMCGSRNDTPFNFIETVMKYTEDINTEGKINKSEIEFKTETYKEKLYFYGLNHCWDKTGFSSNETEIKITYASFWMLRIFLSNLAEINIDEFMNLKSQFGKTKIYKKTDDVNDRAFEVQCFRSMTKNLGYIPAHEYIQEQNAYKETQFEGKIYSYFIRRMNTLNVFWKNTSRLPHIDSLLRQEGSHYLKREEKFHLITNIPTERDISFEAKTNMELIFKDDHFHNVIIGRKSTLFRAKQWWIRTYDLRHILLWSGNTFDPEKGWRTVFPTYKSNAIYTPMSFFLQPYYSDILAIRNAGITILSYREIMQGLGMYTRSDNLFLKEELFTKDKLNEKTEDGSNKSCQIQRFVKNKAVLTDTTFANLFKKYPSLFFNVLALKASFFDLSERVTLKHASYLDLTKERRNWKLFRTLEIPLKDITEEKLFFMTSVRHFCRKIPETNNKRDRYTNSINTVLMQMHEFAKTWNCPISSGMNPPKKCFPEL